MENKILKILNFYRILNIITFYRLIIINIISSDLVFHIDEEQLEKYKKDIHSYLSIEYDNVNRIIDDSEQETILDGLLKVDKENPFLIYTTKNNDNDNIIEKIKNYGEIKKNNNKYYLKLKEIEIKSNIQHKTKGNHNVKYRSWVEKLYEDIRKLDRKQFLILKKELIEYIKETERVYITKYIEKNHKKDADIILKEIKDGNISLLNIEDKETTIKISFKDPEEFEKNIDCFFRKFYSFNYYIPKNNENNCKKQQNNKNLKTIRILYESKKISDVKKELEKYIKNIIGKNYTLIINIYENKNGNHKIEEDEDPELEYGEYNYNFENFSIDKKYIEIINKTENFIKEKERNHNILITFPIYIIKKETEKAIKLIDSEIEEIVKNEEEFKKIKEIEEKEKEIYNKICKKFSNITEKIKNERMSILESELNRWEEIKPKLISEINNLIDSIKITTKDNINNIIEEMGINIKAINTRKEIKTYLKMKIKENLENLTSIYYKNMKYESEINNYPITLDKKITDILKDDKNQELTGLEYPLWKALEEKIEEFKIIDNQILNDKKEPVKNEVKKDIIHESNNNIVPENVNNNLFKENKGNVNINSKINNMNLKNANNNLFKENKGNVNINSKINNMFEPKSRITNIDINKTNLYNKPVPDTKSNSNKNINKVSLNSTVINEKVNSNVTAVKKDNKTTKNGISEIERNNIGSEIKSKSKSETKQSVKPKTKIHPLTKKKGCCQCCLSR